MTASEFWEWMCRRPDSDRRFELHRGEVVEFALCGERHGTVCAWLCYLLWSELKARGSGYVTSNNVLLLVGSQPDTLLGPDLMVFDGSARLAELSREFCTTVPRLAIEVLSPEDDRTATVRRVAHYVRFGIPNIWTVDPESQAVSVYRRSESPVVFLAEDVLTADGALEGWRLPAADIFRFPDTEQAE